MFLIFVTIGYSVIVFSFLNELLFYLYMWNFCITICISCIILFVNYVFYKFVQN